MTTKHQKRWIVAILSFILTSCSKDLSIPNPELEKLFGTWDWKQSSGGIGGQTNTPATVGYSQTVEFNKNGIYKIYKDGIQKDTKKFSLTIGTSIYNSGSAYLINYKDINQSDNSYHYSTQSIRFGGEDSLFLSDECYDCFIHIYTRHK